MTLVSIVSNLSSGQGDSVPQDAVTQRTKDYGEAGRIYNAGDAVV